MQLCSPYSDSVSLRLRYSCTLTSLHTVTRRPILQKARRHHLSMAPTACKSTVSGSLSLPSPGFFSPFPHGTSALSVAVSYLALEGGPPGFRQGFSCPALLRYQQGVSPVSPTGLSPSLADLPSVVRLPVSFVTPQLLALQPHTQDVWFRLLPVRSPLLRESRVDVCSSRYLDGSVPWVSLCSAMYSHCSDRAFPRPGYPIR